MKKLLYLLALITAFVCVFSLYGCGGLGSGSTGSDKPQIEKPSITLSETEVTLIKGQSATVSVLSEKKLDTLSLKWSCSDQKVISFKKDATDLIVKGMAAGEATMTLSMSGKEIATLKVTVVEADLTVRLPEGKIVLSAGDVATVKAVSLIENGGDFIWSVSCDSITLESQGNIARITVSETCPNGRYEAQVTQNDTTCKFTIIIGK